MTIPTLNNIPTNVLHHLRPISPDGLSQEFFEEMKPVTSNSRSRALLLTASIVILTCPEEEFAKKVPVDTDLGDVLRQLIGAIQQVNAGRKQSCIPKASSVTVESPTKGWFSKMKSLSPEDNTYLAVSVHSHPGISRSIISAHPELAMQAQEKHYCMSAWLYSFFEHLEENVPRFMSEFGFQSFPSFEAINYINQSDSIDISSKKFKSHQKHSRGFQLIEEYMKRDFPVPKNLEDYVYVSQLLQAHGISKGIEAHRRAKPYNMGTLYWQLNDCWPVVSWSSIDHFGNWKALHYHAKHAFDNLLISGYLKNDTLNIYLVNDELKAHTGELNIEILDFNGNIKHKISKTISTPENSSEIYYQLPINSLNINREEIVIKGTFKDKTSLFYLTKPKNLNLAQSPIKQKISKNKDGFSISLSSNYLQKNVFLYSTVKGKFSDNYFDLLPGEIKKIQFTSKSNSLENVKIKTLNELINL